MKNYEPLEQQLEALGQTLEPEPSFEELVMTRVRTTTPEVSSSFRIRRLISIRTVKYLSPAIAAMVLITIAIFGISPHNSAIALSDLVNTMHQRWVYMSHHEDNNPWNTYEFWIYAHGNIEAKRDRYGTTYTDLNQAKTYRYVPQAHTILIEYPWSLINETPAEKEKNAKTVMNRPYKELKFFQGVIKHLGLKPKVRTGKFNRHEVQIQDYIKKDFSDTKPWLTLYIDVPKKLLRGYEHWPTFIGRDPKDTRILHLEAVFDFPETGPQNIYDLDVPQDAEVVNRVDPTFVDFWKTCRIAVDQARKNWKVHGNDPAVTPRSKRAKMAWPNLERSHTIIEDEYSRANDLICIERLQKKEYIKMPIRSGRFLHYVDPAKNYVCHRRVTIWQGTPDDEAFMVVDEVTEYQQINGFWYPLDIRTRSTTDLGTYDINGLR
ncbi:MAG: hypothetical protein HQ515_10460 [Phycisphaeraceae bacterium]|nr:hypothetical protein [Phycisphaeraceae bacterium]